MIGLVPVFKSLDALAIIILAPESSTLLATLKIPVFSMPTRLFGTNNRDSTGLYFKPSGVVLTQPLDMLGRYNMNVALPRDTPTLEASSTGNHKSRQCFLQRGLGAGHHIRRRKPVSMAAES